MMEALRPMSTGELLDRTFRLYRQHFKLFIGIATVGPAASLIFQLLVSASSEIPGARSPRFVGLSGASLGAGVLAGVVIMLAGMALSHAATVKAVAAVYLGRETSIGEAYKALKGRVWRVLGVFGTVIGIVFVCTVVIIAVAATIGSLAVVGGAQAGTAGAVIGGLVGLAAAVTGGILAITIWVRYAVAIQACVVEDQRIMNSLRRSAILTKGSRSRILTVYVVFAVITWIVAIGFGFFAGMLAAVIPNKILGMVCIYLASFLAGSLTGPLATIGISLVYYDERIRKEAFDLQLMMMSLDQPVPATTPLAAAP